MEFNYETKVPKERVAILLGIDGKVKSKIEKALNVKIVVDSKEGSVLLNGDDGVALMTAQNIVKAIGRGFNPNYAMELLDESNNLEIIDITNFSHNLKKDIVRLRSRTIGTGGKARTTIEYLTNTKVVIYGKTISIIGDYEGVALARKAFESLLTGSRHSTVYSWLEKQRKKMSVKLY